MYIILCIDIVDIIHNIHYILLALLSPSYLSQHFLISRSPFPRPMT